MVKGSINKIVGRISDEIVERYKLYDYRNTEIVQSINVNIKTDKYVKVKS